jgi:hypothetical protein
MDIRESVRGAGPVERRFDYYTGKTVIAMTGSLSGNMIIWQAGDLGSPGVLEVHHIGRPSSVRRNNRVLGSGDYHYDATTQMMTIPVRGATSVQIR